MLFRSVVEFATCSPVSWDHLYEMHQYYRPPRLDLHLQLFTTVKTPLRVLLFWYYYARRGVRIHRLFEEHTDFYQPHNAEPLAALLRQLLDENENPGKGV